MKSLWPRNWTIALLAAGSAVLLSGIGGWFFLHHLFLHTHTYEIDQERRLGQTHVSVSFWPLHRVQDAWGDRRFGPPYDLTITVTDIHPAVKAVRLYGVTAEGRGGRLISAELTRPYKELEERYFAHLYVRLADAPRNGSKLKVDLELISPDQSIRGVLRFALRKVTRRSLDVP